MTKGNEIDHSWYLDVAAPHSTTNLKELLPDVDKHSTAVRSVYRSANILTCLSNGISTITDISVACKLNKATVHRLLKALSAISSGYGRPRQPSLLFGLRRG